MLLDSVGNGDGRSRGREEGTEFNKKSQISVPASATVTLAVISKNSGKRMTTETACENDDGNIFTCYK